MATISPKRELAYLRDENLRQQQAIDTIRARAEKVEAEVMRLRAGGYSDYINVCEKMKDERDAALGRAAKAEETARVLAEQLGKGNFGKINECLEWATQEAAKRFATPSCETCSHNDTNCPDACDKCVYGPDVDESDSGMSNYWEPQEAARREGMVE